MSIKAWLRNIEENKEVIKSIKALITLSFLHPENDGRWGGGEDAVDQGLASACRDSPRLISSQYKVPAKKSFEKNLVLDNVQ